MRSGDRNRKRAGAIVRMIRLVTTYVLASVTPSLWAHASVAQSGLTYLVHEPAVKTGHPPLIMLLHGSGADEKDMIGLAPQLPDTFVVVSPRAPFRDAGGGYRWYGRAAATRTADIATSRRIVDTMVADAVKRFDADPQRVFLAGFSQGAVMVYEVALREPGRFRGAAVLSGTLFPFATSGLAAGGETTHESFFVAHGTADDRIAFGTTAAARATLARLGVPTVFHAYPGMSHTIGAAETRDLSAWLSERAATRPDGSSR